MVKPNQIQDVINRLARTYWTLEKEERKFFLSSFIRRWEGKWLRQQVDNGRLTYEGDRYNIVWLDTPETCYKAKKVGLSFRKQSPGVADVWKPNYVLIKVWKDKEI